MQLLMRLGFAASVREMAAIFALLCFGSGLLLWTSKEDALLSLTSVVDLRM